RSAFNDRRSWIGLGPLNHPTTPGFTGVEGWLPVRTGDAGRGIPVRRAGATLVTSALGAEDERGDPAAGPVSPPAATRLNRTPRAPALIRTSRRRRAADDRLHHDVLEVAGDALRRRLNHEDRDELLFGIDPEVRAVGAAPPEAAFGQERIPGHGIL